MKPSPRQLLDHADCAAFLVSDLVNIHYLTGLQLSNGLLLVFPRSYVLFTDARYLEGAQQKAPSNVAVRDMAELTMFFKKVPECGFERDHVTVGRFQHWKKSFPRTKFLAQDDPLEFFRRQKDEAEQKYLLRAQRMTKELLRRVPSALRKGVTEKALAWKLRLWAQELGADGLSFDPIVAFGTHTSRPHHQPTTRALQKGHIVQIDVGVMYKGYCGDLSQVFFTADPSPVQLKAYKAVQASLQAVLDAVRPGMSTRKLDALARAELQKHGFTAEQCFPYALGHGIGLEPHEQPFISSSPHRPEQFLEAGDVLAIEPGLYVPGKFGMRIEEMIVVPKK